MSPLCQDQPNARAPPEGTPGGPPLVPDLLILIAYVLADPGETCAWVALVPLAGCSCVPGATQHSANAGANASASKNWRFSAALTAS